MLRGFFFIFIGEVYGAEVGVKRYDWRIEKEIATDVGRTKNENIVFMQVQSAFPEKNDQIDFVLKGTEFGKFHNSLTELRKKCLQMLGQ